MWFNWIKWCVEKFMWNSLIGCMQNYSDWAIKWWNNTGLINRPKNLQKKKKHYFNFGSEIHASNAPKTNIILLNSNEI